MISIMDIEHTRRRVEEANRLYNEVREWQATQRRLAEIEELVADDNRRDTLRRVHEIERLYDGLEREGTLSRLHHARTII